MFPNGLALQILCQTRDLCTKREGLRVWPNGLCYKSHSNAKLLIFNSLPVCTFSGHLSQALDFSRLGGRRRLTINKVIHTFSSIPAKLIQINDLNGLSENDVNSRA
jgi:Zn-dependent protease